MSCAVHICQAQPSRYVNFIFKLYDSSGKPVDYKRFCKSYKLLGAGDRNDQTPSTNKYILKDQFYNPKTKVYNAGSSVVYNDLFRKFIYRTDTMVLIFNTQGGTISQPYKIDSLVFRAGKYRINDHSQAFIQFDKAAVAFNDYDARIVL